MPDQKPSQEITMTFQGDAHLKNVAAGNQNQLISEAEARNIIQASNGATVNIFDKPSAPGQAEAAAERVRQYALSVFELCNKIDLISLKADASKECPRQLATLYTALWTRDYEPKEHEERFALGRADRQPRQRSAVDWLNTQSRLVLLGDPGSGKSTFVKFVALCLAGERLGYPDVNLNLLTVPPPDDKDEEKQKKPPQPWEHGALLPIFIVLREFAATALPDDGTPATVAHVLNYLRKMLAQWGKAECAPDLEAALKAGQALLLFDGLDEVPEAHQRRAQILQAIQAVATHYPSRILVTSRTYAYQEQQWKLDRFADTELAKFNQRQIASFVAHWYGEMVENKRIERSFADARTAALQQAIASRDQLRELAERPLLLTLMAVLHSSTNTELPDKRIELYAQATNVLLEWWEAGKGGAYKSLLETLNISKDALFAVLQRLAFAAHQRQPLSDAAARTADIAQAELINELYKLNKEKVAEAQAHLCQRAGLLVSHGNEVYTFPHRSFQEYLAACHLTADRAYPQNIADLLRDSPDRWREVVLLAAAKVADTPFTFNGLINKLCMKAAPKKANSATTVAAYGALLAAQAVVEAQQVGEFRAHERKMFARLRGWLTALLTAQQPKQPLPALERAKAGDLLSAFGDDRPGVGLISPPGRGAGWVPGLPDIDWVHVPAGEFWMGSAKDVDEEAEDDEQPRHRVDVPEFWLSRYPITNAQYRAFVNDGGYTTEKYWTNNGWQWRQERGLTAPEPAGREFDLDNHPVVNIAWYEAMAFCAWLTGKLTPNPSLWKREGERDDSSPNPLLLEKEEGFAPPLFSKERGPGGELIIRLPTEAEWEYAARGSDENYRRYPWGDDISPEHANYRDTNLNATSAVGCFPKGRTWRGAEDMIGNVWEWCLHDRYAYQTGEPVAKDTLENLDKEKAKALRGGPWTNHPHYCRCAYRSRNNPDRRFDDLGFRPVVAVAWVLHT